MSADTDVYGKKVSDLQTDVTVDDTEITGTLKHVTGYTGFNGTEVDEQSGNFLALQVDVPEGATATTELLNGDKGPVDITSDKFCVYRITDKDTQQIKVEISMNGEKESNVYDLSNLVLETE